MTPGLLYLPWVVSEGVFHNILTARERVCVEEKLKLLICAELAVDRVGNRECRPASDLAIPIGAKVSLCGPRMEQKGKETGLIIAPGRSAQV